MTKQEKIAELRSRAEHALRRSLSVMLDEEVPEVSNLMDTLSLQHLELELEIENLKHAQAELKVENQRYKELFYEAPIAYITVNNNGKIINVNRAAKFLFKKDAKEIRRRSIFEFIESNSINDFDSKLNESFASHSDQYGIIELKDENESILVKVHLSVFTDPESKNDLCRLVLTDIGDEKNAFEQEIKQKERAYQKLASDISEGIFDTQNGIIITSNPAFANIFKYDQEELEGKAIWDLATNCYSKLIKKLFLKNDNLPNKSSYDIQCFRKDGSVFWAELKIKHCCEEGKAFGTLSDISGRKKTEKELKRSERKLKSSNAAKDKFFSILAHDLKTPFNTLNGYTYLLMKDYNEYDEEKRKSIIQALYDSTKQTFNLLENILVWSRSQTGGLKYSPRNINISKLIIENIRLFNPTASAKGITLSASLLNENYGYADPEMIQTVIRNLITNAIKFTPENGKVEIAIDSSDDNILTISVSDTGMGVSSENQNKLFRIDHNYSSPGTNDEKGTGLGLILCREFVMKNKGEIWMESIPGKGSTFYFTISKHQYQ